MGLEPTTFCLGSRHSTIELHPLICSHYSDGKIACQVNEKWEKNQIKLFLSL